ncbi:MAG: transporter, family, multidrug resistance protein [Actinomycetota bacterium]|jgi:MFS family permease|nr:transporter, family, multidrug resistance protein [Actinomycetota bacterium]MDQ1664112.1 transporter, family, multidrug resistance protein [Actinomycetota bacterium]MDQ1669213.1 transporter, family, multidrug resistance protein [Actinomycetota bacterium]
MAGLPREVVVLTAVAFSVAVGFGIVVPAIPIFAKQFGVSNTAAGAVISAFAFMRLVSALGSGRLVNRVGERVVLATGIGIVAVSSALAGLAQSYGQLLLLRGIGGVGSAMFTVSAISLLLRVAAPDQRGRATGMWQSGFLFGAIAGPALGGPLTDISLRAPFFVYAATLAVAGSIGMLFLTHTPLHEREAAAKNAPQRTTLIEALRVSGYRAALVTNLGNGWALFGVRSSLIPLFVTSGLGASATWVGIGFFVSAATQGALLLPAGRLTDTVGRRPAMIIGATVATLSMGLIASLESLPFYVLAMALFGAGAAFLSVAPSATVGDVVAGRGGTVVAAFQMTADLGAVVGPLVAGWLADEYSFAAAFAVTTVVLAAGIVAALLSRETRHRPQPDPEPEHTASPTPAT